MMIGVPVCWVPESVSPVKESVPGVGNVVSTTMLVAGPTVVVRLPRFASLPAPSRKVASDESEMPVTLRSDIFWPGPMS